MMFTETQLFEKLFKHYGKARENSNYQIKVGALGQTTIYTYLLEGNSL